jgi:hypothetical protein
MRWLALTLALLLSVARADDKSEARKHFKRGAELIQTGGYQAALAEFLEAYRRFPNERLHYDIAQAYRLSGDKERAIVHYRKYLSSIDVGRAADDARRQLRLLVPPEPSPSPSPAAVARVAPLPVPAAVIAPPALTRAPPPRPLAKRPWLWIAVGSVAAVGVAVGLGVGLTVKRYPSPSITTIDVGKP